MPGMTVRSFIGRVAALAVLFGVALAATGYPGFGVPLLILGALALFGVWKIRTNRAPVSAPAAPAALNPGWYPDQNGPGQRYWDGRQWTGQTV